MFFLLYLNSEHFAESHNKITFPLVLIQPPNATVGICQFLPAKYFRLSAIVQLRTVHYPNSNISAEITRGHLEKRRNHSDIIGEHQETLPNT